MARKRKKTMFKLYIVLVAMFAGVIGCEEERGWEKGRWVYDETYPLYTPSSCPFVETEFDCGNNGRPDHLYLKYRWQPDACNFPSRFQGEDFLNKLRGKNLMFVGDSLSLNQWQSLTCMLHTSLPTAKYTLTRKGGLSTFAFQSFNVKVMFLRNAFLVDIVQTTRRGKVLKLDSIKGGKAWKGVDILIFDTWHWWKHTGRKQPWDMVEANNRTYKDMDRLVAFGKALNTWAKWVDSNVNPAITKVFFQGISPDHSNAKDWGEKDGNNCLGQTTPVSDVGYPAGQHPAEIIVEKVLKGMLKPVFLLNITSLSQMRKDGHPSVYGHRGRAHWNVSRIAASAIDCSHWCLPGIPDTWNLMFYASLVHK